MLKHGCIFSCIMIMVMLFKLAWLANGQKTYAINSIYSDIILSQSDGCISMKIIEDFEYEFNGSYSRIGRALPYSVFPKIDSYKVEVLTQGYSVSYQMQVGDVSSFIVSTLNPATPANSNTKISIRITMVVFPNVELFSSNSDISYYYKDNAQTSFISTSMQFDYSFNPCSLYSPNGQLQNNSQIVIFSTNNLPSDTRYQPMVTINNFIATKCYSIHNEPYIIAGTITGSIILIVSIFCAGFISYLCYRDSCTGYFKKNRPNQPVVSPNPTIFQPPVSTIKVSTTSYKPTTLPSTNTEEIYYNTTSTYTEPVTSTYSNGYDNGVNYSNTYDNSGWCDNTGGGNYGGGGDYGGTSGFAD